MKKKRPSEAQSPAGGYRKILLKKRADLIAGLGTKFDTVAEMGLVAEEDQAQASHDEFVSLHLNALDYAQLRLIDEALKRIRSGGYGVCLACEQPIPPKRLRAVPWARYCVECQEDHMSGAEDIGEASSEKH